MALTHLERDVGAEAITEALGRDGAVVIDDVMPTELRDRVSTELAPSMAATPAGPDDFSGRNTRRTGALIARSPACRELVMHPLILGAVAQFLGHATNFQLHLTQAIAIGPESPAQPIHRDQWAFDFFEFPAGYEVQCNTIWALTDF
ncbi:MAG TPA: phytanoyl-CoA dioxygenase family protein, partial [Acidimicrobiales bacterium]|nr:phytanoyl-CoA dioxygenase family protein [Acidimicrobiales bacterium]